MNLLKEYIRHCVRRIMLEQAPPPPPPPPSGGPMGGGASSNKPSINPYPPSSPPRLPNIRPATGIGAVPKDSGAVNSDRVEFAEAAKTLFQNYIDTTNRNRRFDPITARNLNNVANQVMQQLIHDTNNWSDIEPDLEQRLLELKPEDSALQLLIDLTAWYKSTPPDSQTLQQNYTQITSDLLPKITDGLEAYIENYS